MLQKRGLMKMGATGFEHHEESLEKKQISKDGGADSGALAQLLEAISSLTREQKQALLDNLADG